MSLQFAGNMFLQSTGFPVPINLGGTGQTTDITARNALLPVQTGQNGKALVTDGVNVMWSTIQSNFFAPDTQIIYGTGASTATNINFTYDDSLGILTVGSEVSSRSGQLLTLNSDTAITLAVQGTDRLTIGTNGIISVSGDPGTNGQVLTSTGPGSAPSWQAPSAGSVILTGDVTGSGIGTITTTLATVNGSPQIDAFRKVTITGQGLVTASSAVSSLDITTALGYVPSNDLIPDFVSVTTQLGVTGYLYILTAVSPTTVTLPASPVANWELWITVTNNLTNNVVARNGSNIMALAQDMNLDMNNYTYKFRYLGAPINSWWLV